MSISRRQFLARVSAAGLLTSLPTTLVACSDDGDGLPRYVYGGALGPDETFAHGVASGDPLTDAVILWTRVTVGEVAASEPEVFVEVATDPSFRRRVIAQYVSTDASKDFTVRLDASGLAAGTSYYYRFSALGRTSPVGRTRTAPDGACERLRLAFVSCSNVGFGHFYAYRHLARRADLDAIVHLGDYIYEYGIDPGLGEVYGNFRQDLDPPGQTVTKEEYRRRYAYYRLDADLAELHRQNPFIHIWDDHEFANDPYVGGAENHSVDTQGAWSDRVANALAAYSEWMPTRLADGGRVFRHFTFGDLADLVLVDRQRPFLFPAPDDGSEYLGKEQQGWLDDRIASGSSRWLVLGTGTTFGPHDADLVSDAGWDPESRARVLASVDAAQRENLIVVSGDIHRMEALEIVQTPATYVQGTGEGSAGIELSAGSITSPGGTSTTTAPQYLWNDGYTKGYVVLDLTPSAASADFFGSSLFVIGFGDEPREECVASFQCAHGAKALVRVEAPAPDRTDAPELAPAPTMRSA